MKRSLLYISLIAVMLLPMACAPATQTPSTGGQTGATQAPVATTAAQPSVAPAATTAPQATEAPAATTPATTVEPTTAAAVTPAAGATGSPTAAPPPPEREAKGGIRKSSSTYSGDLNLWVLGYTPGNAFANPFDNAVSQFKVDNPEINVNIIGYPPNDEGFTRLTTALQSGQSIDLLRLPSDRLPQFVADDLVEPIDPYLTDEDKADILPNVLGVTRLGDGQAYAWPLWVVPMGIYLNLDVFEEAGVDLPPQDWTWDQFVETAKALTFERDNGEQVYGFAGFIDPGVINTWGLWMNEDPSVRPIADGQFGFDTPEAYAGLKRVADLALVHKVTPPDFGALQDAAVKGGFTNGQFAMIVDATGPAAAFKGQGVNFEIYPHPTVNGNKLTVGAVGLIAVAAQQDEQKRLAAMDLGRYLTSAEVQEDVPPGSNVPTGFYLAPGARQSVQVPDPLTKFIPMLPDMWVTPLVPGWAQFTRLMHPQYQNIIFGQIEPQAAMEEIAEEANELLTATE